MHNENKPWECGHTHFQTADPGYNLYLAKRAAYLALNKKFPDEKSDRFIDSLIRVSEDEEYIKKLENLKITRQQKGRKTGYYNIPAVLR